MIIKFQTATKVWQMYDDVDSLQYQRVSPDNSELDGMEDVIDNTLTLELVDKVPPESYSGRVLLEFMNSNQLAESRVMAFSPIYLMNNQGRTIETI